LPNRELRGELIEKKEQVRGIIYDTLREEINNRREIPSIEEIKGVIIRRVNSAISTGKINDIYITQFLAV
jgi:flagellar basal body-associated protein FliL